jgi:hypothetical protein
MIANTPEAARGHVAHLAVGTNDAVIERLYAAVLHACGCQGTVLTIVRVNQRQELLIGRGEPAAGRPIDTARR